MSPSPPHRQSDAGASEGDNDRSSPLLASYLERRADMRRYFLAKLGPDADVEDLVQDLYLKVLGLGDAAVTNPPAFLYRLASNLMLDRLRQGRRARMRDADWRSSHHASLGAVDIVDAPDAESVVIARLRLEKVMAALSALSPRTQRIFKLHKIDGLSYVETAAALGISKSAVEKQISLALGHLHSRVTR
ncbi:RNA polymerase subunit sigma-24 [Caulobacter segnis]|uniref:RNA polymerase subunit sigma-24 n=1 Tax=Caulobacter segnis TaxID=88688 RepID=A0ABM6TMJ0_9CAUL|nr:RNA polymerase subunit sigma-24 [Caulobacter segnis]